MTARLVTQSADPDDAAEYVLARDSTSVGRDSENDIVLKSPGASRHHARIARAGSTFTVEDSGSRNGTWLNGARIDAPAYLSDGDHLRFDDQDFLFIAEDDASRTIARAKSSRHETVTVMFADLVGHTAMFEALGPDQMYRVLDASMGRMRSSVTLHGGRTVKTEGDSIMASFASIGEAVSCAVEIQRRLREPNQETGQAIPVRIGINSGEVRLQDGDLTGLAVIKAARVMAQGGAGQIFMSAVSRMLLGQNASYRTSSKGWFELKGIARRERIFEVEWL